MAVSDISTMGRNTQGVRLIRLDESQNEYVATVTKVEKDEDKTEEELTKPIESADPHLEDDEVNEQE